MARTMPLLAPMSAVAIVAEPPTAGMTLNPTAGVTVIVPKELSYWMVIECQRRERRVGSGHQVSRGV